MTMQSLQNDITMAGQWESIMRDVRRIRAECEVLALPRNPFLAIYEQRALDEMADSEYALHVARRPAKESWFDWFEHTGHSVVSALTGVVVAGWYYSQYVPHDQLMILRTVTVVFFMSLFVWFVGYRAWTKRRALVAWFREFGSDMWEFSGAANIAADMRQSLAFIAGYVVGYISGMAAIYAERYLHISAKAPNKRGAYGFLRIHRVTLQYRVSKRYKPL